MPLMYDDDVPCVEEDWLGKRFDRGSAEAEIDFYSLV